MPPLTSADQHLALEQHAVLGAVAPRSLIGVRGADRATYLHGLLTNDVKALAPGQGCYAAWLTPQGRMLTDMYVFELGGEILLDVPAEVAGATLQRLDEFLFSEDVQVADLSTETPVWIHGPAAAERLETILGDGLRLAAWEECQTARSTFDGSPVVIARVSQLGVPGYCVYTGRHEALGQALQSAGAMPASSDVIEAARIEAGYPVFGVDMTEETIPLEAGIENRAISFTKGCYVGQEVIVRVLHRGHGRVVRKLVGLVVEGSVPARGARISSAERAIGVVTSAALSPVQGPIAMGYVHREFTAAGTRVDVDTASGRVAATVTELPFPERDTGH